MSFEIIAEIGGIRGGRREEGVLFRHLGTPCRPFRSPAANSAAERRVARDTTRHIRERVFRWLHSRNWRRGVRGRRMSSVTYIMCRYHYIGKLVIVVSAMY